MSWPYAFGELKKRIPNATYEVLKFENNLPYVYDENTGYMVFTRVTIEGVTNEMWLPVMDGANKAMKNHPYTYKAKEWNRDRTFKWVEKTVEPATMFDINKTIMRCLVKNIAVASGIGLYIFAGEDLPETPEQVPTVAQPKAQPKPDTRPTIPEPIQIPTCLNCGKPVEAGGGMSAEQVAKARFEKYGMALCGRCANEMRNKLKKKAEKLQDEVNITVEEKPQEQPQEAMIDLMEMLGE